MKETEVSATALRVLQGLVYTATRPSTAHLVSPDARDAARRLMTRSQLGRKRLRQLDRADRYLLVVLERLLVPGISVQYALRKRWIEERVRAGLSSGVEQVINLGAGLDTLLLRLSIETPALRCIEVDHPASQKAKHAALEAEPVSERFSLLPVDFGKETLAERLPAAESFSPEARTIVIVEGVLVYLEEPDVRDLFTSLRQLLGPDTTVLFTFLAQEPPTGQPPYGPLLKAYLRFAEEPMRFRIEPDALAGFLDPLGFDLEEVAFGPHLLDEIGAPAYHGPLHDLEVMAAARAR